jgi:hypothetical protein
MATWKKVAVSGSDISQFNNDAGYLTSVTAQNTFATMSINGVNVIADGAVDTLTFASSSGAGLNIVGNAGSDSITFTLGNIPNTSLANSTISGKSLGTNLDSHTAGSGLSGTAYNGSAAQTWTVNSGSMQTFFNSSSYAGVSGDILINASTGVATIQANSVALGTDTTGDYVASITSGNGLTGGTSGEGSTPTLAVGAGTHITVNPDDVAVDTTTLIPAISGSILTTISGDIAVTAQGVATIQANSVALGTDTTGNYAAAVSAGSGILVGGSAGEGTTFTVSVNSGSMLPYYSSSIFGTVSGDITISSAGVAAIGSGVIVNADVNASAAIAASKINFTGTSFVSASVLSSPSQGSAVLTTNGVAGSTIDLGLQTGDSPQFVALTLTGDAAVNGGDITTTAATFNLVNSNATTVNFAGAATTLNIGNASGTATIPGNAIVQGNFTVNGTTTYLNVQDLYVEDKFIVLASGSATAGDGGIIIDRGSDAAGNIAYGYDSVTDRWGFQNGVTDTTNTIDPTSAAGVSGSFVPYLFTENDHGATKPITGEFAVQGAMYTSNAGDIWIYA